MKLYTINIEYIVDDDEGFTTLQHNCEREFEAWILLKNVLEKFEKEIGIQTIKINREKRN